MVVHKGQDNFPRHLRTWTNGGRLEFACYHSPVLNAAFNSDFEEGRTQTYYLQDIRKSTFQLFVRWLYTQRVDIDLDDYRVPNVPKFSSETDSTTHEGHCSNGAEMVRTEEDFPPTVTTQSNEHDLVQLWVLADRLMIPALQNDTIRQLEVLWTSKAIWPMEGGDGIPVDLTYYIYNHTTQSSPLRHLFLDQIAYAWNPAEVIERHPQGLPNEMLAELLMILGNAVRPGERKQQKGNPFYYLTRMETGSTSVKGIGEAISSQKMEKMNKRWKERCIVITSGICHYP